jgi:hypothetical protein
MPPGAGPPPPPRYEPPGTGPGYPLRADIAHQAEYSRFMPLVKWLLLLPHYVVLMLLGIAAFAAVVISWFAVVFTRRYPRGLYDFVVGVHRWAWRVQAYLFLMVDPYPPFTLADDPAYPARFDLTYPEEIDRWRPIVQWLLVIPYAFIAGILGWLAEILALFAFFTILFTKRFPEELFNIALVGLRWQARALVYGEWLVTRYPPWAWE